MNKITHMCLSVRGALNMSKSEMKRMAPSITVDGKQLKTADELRGGKRPEHSEIMRKLRISKKVKLTPGGRKSIGESAKERILKNGHPRGMKGKTHSEQLKKENSERSIRMWANPNHVLNSDAHRQTLSDRTMKLNAKGVMRNGYSRGKQGKREDIGIYVRSSWEANYARYLNWIKEKGQIFNWEYEPDTFWFEKIKRGVRSYLPDFKIWETENSIPYYVEVKGWMDAKSQTKLKRMAKYYPKVKIELVEKAQYKEIEKWSRLIPGWE